MRDLVAGESDMMVLEETSADQVTQSVVFLVEGEDGG